VYTVSGKALDRFQEWVADTAPTLDLPSFDQATLFTGSVVSLTVLTATDHGGLRTTRW